MLQSDMLFLYVKFLSIFVYEIEEFFFRATLTNLFYAVGVVLGMGENIG